MIMRHDSQCFTITKAVIISWFEVCIYWRVRVKSDGQPGYNAPAGVAVSFTNVCNVNVIVLFAHGVQSNPDGYWTHQNTKRFALQKLVISFRILSKRNRKQR